MNATFSTSPFSVNGRRYEPPAKPVVAICMDGCEDDYLTVALARGRMPHLARMAAGGYRGLARGSSAHLYQRQQRLPSSPVFPLPSQAFPATSFSIPQAARKS